MNMCAAPDGTDGADRRRDGRTGIICTTGQGLLLVNGRPGTTLAPGLRRHAIRRAALVPGRCLQFVVCRPGLDMLGHILTKTDLRYWNAGCGVLFPDRRHALRSEARRGPLGVIRVKTLMMIVLSHHSAGPHSLSHRFVAGHCNFFRT